MSFDCASTANGALLKHEPVRARTDVEPDLYAFWREETGGGAEPDAVGG